MSKNQRIAIGIDLGTTYSCAAFFKNGKIEVILNDQGNRTTPSYIGFTNNARLVGDGAYYQACLNPKNTIFAAKRLIGREFNEKEVQSDINYLPYNVVNINNRPHIEINSGGDYKQLPVEEVASMILVKLKEAAELTLEREVTDAVITVPAYFNDSQRQSTKDAATIAGFNVLRIINEPTAAALAYGFNLSADDYDNRLMKKKHLTDTRIIGHRRSQTDGRNILVYDLGGGTFDVSVLNISKGIFTVKATDGDTHLGGEDFDNKLVRYFSKQFEKETGRNVTSDARGLAKLKNACEIAKRSLSTNIEAKINIESFIDGISLVGTITRAAFEQLCADLFNSTLDTVKNVLIASGIEKYAIDEIILVGGSTRIPKIQSLVSEFFGGKKPNKSIHPDEAVAHGAAIQAAMLINDEMASITKNLHLHDVSSLSLGIRLEGGMMHILIPRNTSLPSSVTEKFYNTMDYQKLRTYSIYEGEKKMVKDNHLLGEFILENVTLARKGEAEVSLTMSLDCDGLLEVSAIDQGTGSYRNITVTNQSNRLTDEQIVQLIRNADEYYQKDQEELLRDEARNNLEHYVYSIVSAFEDHSNKLSPINRSIIEDEIDSMCAWLESTMQGSIAEYEYNHDLFKSKVHSIMSPYLAGI
ncbi:heat shock protein 70 family [Scheffersomyces coipomensis]|uniref:heat shock protein 70 family n=1 Tax=Scheffersomyces coipomensis TaxID=1788519 RepID=UPI00315DC593